MMKDYYKILDINSAVSEDEIRKAYRKLALKHHPDRNPGNIASEERFKEIAEAYAILINKSKRAEYNNHLKRSHRTTTQSVFASKCGREDFFREMFHNPGNADFFSDLQHEFEKQGYRFNENFFNDLFSRRQHVFGSGIYSGNRIEIAHHPRGYNANKSIVNLNQRAEDTAQFAIPSDSPFKGLQRLSRFFRMRFSSNLRSHLNNTELETGCGLAYLIRVSEREAIIGKQIRFSLKQGCETKKISVRIPPGVKNGTRLKLTGLESKKNKAAHYMDDVYFMVKII